LSPKNTNTILISPKNFQNGTTKNKTVENDILMKTNKQNKKDLNL